MEPTNDEIMENQIEMSFISNGSDEVSVYPTHLMFSYGDVNTPAEFRKFGGFFGLLTNEQSIDISKDVDALIMKMSKFMKENMDSREKRSS